MDDFLRLHRDQLEALNIPELLFEPLKCQLDAIYPDDDDLGNDGPPPPPAPAEEAEEAEEAGAVVSCISSEPSRREALVVDGPAKALDTVRDESGCGSILVMPHVCSWDVDDPRGLWRELSKLSDATLHKLRNELNRRFPVAEGKEEDPVLASALASRRELLRELCRPRTWSVVVLYRAHEGSGVRAALPAPPYYPQVTFDDDREFASKEVDLTGPFPFRFHLSSKAIDVSLLYLSPGIRVSATKLPTLDAVPSYSVPDSLTRSVRYAALLLDADQLPDIAQRQVEEYYEAFLASYHDDSRRRQCRASESINGCILSGPPAQGGTDKVLKVFTDSDDPMGLAHPEAGLTDPHFELTKSVADADIVFSCRSLFAPTGALREALDARQDAAPGRAPALINQFPYEGAFVQKDHLARELWSQYGIPVLWPAWAIESYDLDVQFGGFVGANLRRPREEEGRRSSSSARENDGPAWIVKPAGGTQSKGHVVTRSVAHIRRLLDAGGPSRVVQRYIEKPLCYQGRKVDCRCVILMTDATPGRPTLYVHDRVFLRIAHNRHDVSEPDHLMDPETVLTATHLFHDADRSAPDKPLPLLPVDRKTIRHLEEDYGFCWKTDVLPKIHEMIRELFNGLTGAYPAMSAYPTSRAVYGVDVMFEVSPTSNQVQPKLTEVTFCPANNATCAAYERDETLYRTYLNDIFNCLFRGVVSASISPI